MSRQYSGIEHLLEYTRKLRKHFGDEKIYTPYTADFLLFMSCFLRLGTGCFRFQSVQLRHTTYAFR